MTAATVYLVGAGPGNPGLLTLRAVECLARADLVLYDRLVPLALLAHAPASARRLCVTDLPGRHPERAPEVLRLMTEAARAGQCVVRLKGGDPHVFGRGAEEAARLAHAGIPFEVVPGITAALAAAAHAGIPLTHRDHASAVALVTGHEHPGKDGSTLDWAALARFPGTLVFYMSVTRLEPICAALLAHGKPADTPAAVVQQAGTGAQRTVAVPLYALPAAVRAAGLHAPALTIVGPVVALRDEINWFEHLPLFGRGVLVTRPRHQAGGLVRAVEERGGVPYLLPAVAIRPPADWGPVDQALAQLPSFDWLVFTSSNGVEAFLDRLRATGRDLRALGGVRLAAIGPGTANVLRAYHLEPDLVPDSFNSEALAEALSRQAAGLRILLARADRGREVLRDILGPVAHVEQVAVYSQVDEPAADPDVLAALREGRIGYALATSSNIGRSLARLIGPEGEALIRDGTLRVVSISPVTTRELRALGWPVAAEAAEATIPGVLQALEHLAGRTRNPAAADADRPHRS